MAAVLHRRQDRVLPGPTSFAGGRIGTLKLLMGSEHHVDVFAAGMPPFTRRRFLLRSGHLDGARPVVAIRMPFGGGPIR